MIEPTPTPSTPAPAVVTPPTKGALAATGGPEVLPWTIGGALFVALGALATVSALAHVVARSDLCGSPSCTRGRRVGRVVQPKVRLSPVGTERINMAKQDGTVAEVAVLPTCDFCTMVNEHSHVEASFDGKTKQGPWANMCTVHYGLYGTGLGTGKGQRLVLAVAPAAESRPMVELSCSS